MQNYISTAKCWFAFDLDVLQNFDVRTKVIWDGETKLQIEGETRNLQSLNDIAFRRQNKGEKF